MEAAQKSLQSCEQQIVSVLKLASELVSLLHASPGTADEDERMDEFESRFTTYMNTLDERLRVIVLHLSTTGILQAKGVPYQANVYVEEKEHEILRDGLALVADKVELLLRENSEISGNLAG
ncbi:MAG: hypothetical protein SGCHY_005050 [Lobulomycetales sp.]